MYMYTHAGREKPEAHARAPPSAGVRRAPVAVVGVALRLQQEGLQLANLPDEGSEPAQVDVAVVGQVAAEPR